MMTLLPAAGWSGDDVAHLSKWASRFCLPPYREIERERERERKRRRKTCLSATPFLSFYAFAFCICICTRAFPIHHFSLSLSLSLSLSYTYNMYIIHKTFILLLLPPHFSYSTLHNFLLLFPFSSCSCLFLTWWKERHRQTYRQTIIIPTSRPKRKTKAYYTKHWLHNWPLLLLLIYTGCTLSPHPPLLLDLLLYVMPFLPSFLPSFLPFFLRCRHERRRNLRYSTRFISLTLVVTSALLHYYLIITREEEGWGGIMKCTQNEGSTAVGIREDMMMHDYNWEQALVKKK